MTPDEAVKVLGKDVCMGNFDTGRQQESVEVLLAERERLLSWEEAGKQYLAERDELRKTLEQVSAERQRLREAVEMIAGQRPCLDNLMSNVDIARSALAGKAQP